MNEFDLACAVFLSSGAGYLLGKHYERKRARAAFAAFTKKVVQNTTVVQSAIMAVVTKRLPDLDERSLALEMAAECRTRGIQVVVADMQTGKVEDTDDNAAK